LNPKQLDLADYVPFFLASVANRMSGSASRTYLKSFGIGVNEWRLLANLKIQPGATAAEICEKSAIDKSVASRALRVLADRGCIADSGKADDLRRRPLALTATGEALHDAVLEVALDRERVLLDGFDAAEKRQLLHFLERLYRNVSALEPPKDNDVKPPETA
jgi:DNA-binding MarR family transcriptional regulator